MSAFGSGPMKFNATLNSFFDRESILTPARKAEKTFLGKVGGYCRKTAMNSIKSKPANEHSAPGDPPFNHAGSLGFRVKVNGKKIIVKSLNGSGPGKGLGYKDFIFYCYDAASHSVYIGPCLLNGNGGTQVCKTLEYGGDELIWTTILGKRVQVMAHFEARPHMRPALAATIASPKFAEALKDCVTNEAGTSARLK